MLAWFLCSTSPPGGNQVDGLPPVVNTGIRPGQHISRRAEVFFYLKRRRKARILASDQVNTFLVNPDFRFEIKFDSEIEKWVSEFM